MSFSKIKKVLFLLIFSGSFLGIKAQTSSPDLTVLLQDPNIILVDVRTPAEYKAEPLDHAINIPLQEIGKRLSEFKNDKKYVVFCRSGVRAGKAKALLEKNNISQVYSGVSFSHLYRLQAQYPEKDILLEDVARIKRLSIGPHFIQYGLGLKKNQEFINFIGQQYGVITILEGKVLLKSKQGDITLEKGSTYEFPIHQKINIIGLQKSNKILFIYQK
ncbi:rhodanese-like domain-containing protein [Elizabethkingia sp. JS20170427COW]|uniref:rhodanese-like domain-containing protein n=1 Tax=Elizabethkingia sp. JS20170427COW TaxID=2583851 RepID=UPI0011108975|nr:rhodanese-like domain-containing protein [Elizabethkingia sp. JS20170427COW]QCX53262.1 rhodanese-like domain-containing protein [Elizabethkingia sp. JS20170427COW]